MSGGGGVRTSSSLDRHISVWKPSMRHSELAIYVLFYVDFESATKNTNFLQPEKKIYEKLNSTTNKSVGILGHDSAQ